MSKRRAIAYNEYYDKYRLIAENAFDLISTMDPVSCEYKYLSPSHSKTIDYSIDELLGQNGLELVHPEDRARVKKIVQAGIIKGQGSAEYRWRTKSGSYIWLESIGKLATNHYGEKEIVLVSRDITERKHMEEALKSSEERYRLIVDNAYEGISIINPDTYQPIYVNPALARMLGYGFEEIINQKFYELVHPEDLENLFKAVKEGENTGSNMSEYRCRKKDGAYIWLETNGKVIKHEGKMRWFCISRDISDRKNAEEQLQKRVDYQNYLMNNMNELFYTYDQNLKFTFVNQKTCETLGYSFKEMIGKSVFEFIHDEDHKKTNNHAMKRLREGDTSIYEHRVICKDGVEKILRVKGSPILVNRRIIGVQIVAEDITEYRKMENEMIRLAQLHTVGEIAAGIGHEIRNPMTTIKGFLQIMSQNLEFSAHRNYFDIMLEELDRANSIISEFLSLAKNKMADLHMKDLNSIINAIFPLLQADASLAEKMLVLDLQEIPLLLLDEKEMRQLIINLVRNGLEAMSPGGAVYISTGWTGHEVRLSVKDQGCGIPDNVLKKLGNPFNTTKENGTGLGLAICYSIAQRHNASIKVRSDDSGTEVLVCFKPKVEG